MRKASRWAMPRRGRKHGAGHPQQPARRARVMAGPGDKGQKPRATGWARLAPGAALLNRDRLGQQLDRTGAGTHQLQ